MGVTVRKHYESLNYFDGQPDTATFRFTRTQMNHTGFLTDVGRTPTSVSSVSFPPARDITMSRADVMDLRNMLTEVLEDWQ